MAVAKKPGDETVRIVQKGGVHSVPRKPPLRDSPKKIGRPNLIPRIEIQNNDPLSPEEYEAAADQLDLATEAIEAVKVKRRVRVRPPPGTLIATFPASIRGARHNFGGNLVLTVLVEEAYKYDALPVTDFRDAVYDITVTIGKNIIPDMAERTERAARDMERRNQYGKSG